MNLRVSNLGSILAGFLSCMFLGWILAHNFAFVGFKLHPFLLCIAAAAIGYGLIEALFAFVLAVALYFGGLLVYSGTLTPQADPHVYILFSFLSTAVVLGMVQNSRIRQLMQTRSELEDVRNEGERLRQRLQVVNTANQKLNERILGEVTTVQSFADIARRLSVLEQQDLYPAVCDLLGDFVHAQESSVYMLEGDHLVLKAQRGWSEVPAGARSLSRDRDLLWTAVEQKKVITPLDLDKMPSHATGEGTRRHRRLICAPIVHPRNGEVVGVLSIDRLPFAHLHGNTLGMLSVIAKWAGDSLFNASSFEQLSRQLSSDEVIQACVPPILLEDRYQQMRQRTQRAALACFRLEGLKSLEARDQKWFRQSLGAALEGSLSKGLTLGRIDEESYALLLDSGEAASAVAKELEAELQKRMEGHPQASRIRVRVGSGADREFQEVWRQALEATASA